MLKFECPHEAEVIRAAWSAAWPAECDQDLLKHVTACRSCTLAVGLAAAFREELKSGCQEARVPSPGLLWWKAQLRARREAGKAAWRPILLAQSVALVSIVAAAAIMTARLSGAVRAALGRAAAWFPTAALPNLDSSLTQPGILLVGAVVLLLAPVAVYLALSRN